MAVDNRLQALKKGVKARTAVELDHRAHQVGVALTIQQVMEQNAFLQRCQRVDVLDIGGSAWNRGGDQFNLIDAQFHQRQHVWRQLRAMGWNAVGGYLEQNVFVLTDSQGHFTHGRRSEYSLYVEIQALLAQTLDQRDGQQ